MLLCILHTPSQNHIVTTIENLCYEDFFFNFWTINKLNYLVCSVEQTNGNLIKSHWAGIHVNGQSPDSLTTAQ